MFELIRIDSFDSCKILLPVGSHIFGRGHFLDVDDKELKISKTHGRFDVTKSTISIISTHTNPCFIQRGGSDQKIILTKNNSCTLTHGDKIGLLPDSFWYKLIYIHHEVNSNSVATGVNRQVRENSEKANEYQTNEMDRSKAQHEGGEVGDDEIALDIAIEDEDNSHGRESPSILEATGTNTEEKTVRTTEDYDVSQTLKRCHSTSITGSGETCTKLIKSEQEPSTSNYGEPELKEQKGSINSVVKTESDAIDHTRDKNKVSNNEHIKEDTNSGPSTPPLPGNNMKERCMYGANCYRRNPQHKAQYSHPGEAEWGAGERSACPWGARCRRRNVRHWRDYDHPPGTHPPAPPVNPPQPAQKKVKKRDKTEELSPVPFDNLPAKRARKTIKRPSWSGDESNNEYDIEDPFLTDGSDEWLPSDTEDYTETQDDSQCY